MGVIFPGWPGPAFHGGRSRVLPPMLPAMLQTPAVGPSSLGSPFHGLAQHGVPISLGPGGNPVLRVGNPQSLAMPPQIEGMPQMPAPPPGLFSGGQR